MSQLPTHLGLPPFRQRPPWIGGDLQTLRDTLCPQLFPPDRAEPLTFPLDDGGQLLGLLDRPTGSPPAALVLVVHGLGGSSDSPGTRRLALALMAAGFAVLRLNLRGAGRCRPLATGTYCASCSEDLRPAVALARQLAGERPLLGAGISLGGTVLLNGCLAGLAFDGLVCLSSPLELNVCTAEFERRRNWVYQRWLVQRLREQTLADPSGLQEAERLAMAGPGRARTIRAFDAAITTPRWGYASVAAYYAAASPLAPLIAGRPLPPTLLLHSADDPWVPVEPLRQLAAASSGHAGDAGAGRAPPAPPAGPRIVITPRGGHNGFHAPGDGPAASWADRLAVAWLGRLSRGEGAG